MPWPEDIAGELPPPHPEEPATLRSDILDELYDHLQSSLEHEQLTEADQDAARDSVLTRFGNPATIACRLWWDAMWGRIMLQRITLGFVALLCCLSIAITFMVWQAMENSQEATAALIAQVQKLAERETVVSPSAEKQDADDRFQYLEWIPVTVKLKDEAGEPITDPEYVVQLKGENIAGDSQIKVISEHPGENGIVDFGLIKPGLRELSVSRTGMGKSKETQHTLRPGAPVELELTCPRQILFPRETEFTIQWPEDLKEEKLWVYLPLTAGSRTVDGVIWYAENSQHIDVLIDPQGRCYQTRLFADEKLAVNLLNTAGGLSFPSVLLEFAIAGKQDDTMFRGSSLSELRVREQYLQGLEKALKQEVYADLSHPQQTVSIAHTGLGIGQYRILKPQVTENSEAPNSLISVLPIISYHGFDRLTDESNAEEKPDADQLVFRPSVNIVELVRKRLEQMEAEEEPGEAGSTEATEVSAETN